MKVSTDKILLPIFSALISFFLGVFLKNEHLEEIPAAIFGLGIIITVIVLSMILFEISRLRSNHKESFDNLQAMVTNQREGFHQARSGEIRDISAKLIPTAGRIRVIGTGRQNIIEDKSHTYKEVEMFYREIEKRLTKPTTGRHAKERFVYERITTRELENGFRNHLKTCLANAAEKGHSASISFIDNFEVAYTYFIIDDKILILNLENLNKKGKMDNILSLICQDPAIINNYIKHFDRVHKGLHKIRDPQEFETELMVISPLVKILTELRAGLNNMPTKSLAMKHAKLEIEQTHHRVMGLKDNLLEIDHKIANGKMLNIFGIYMEELSGGFTYQTISFYEFWEDIMRTDERKLFNINGKALKDGAEMERVFMVNNDWINQNYNNQNSQYDWATLVDTVRNHVELSKKFKKYKFDLLFCSNDRYQDYLKRYYNFGILKREGTKEKILFIPNHTNSNKRRDVRSTSLRYLYNGDSKKKYKQSNLHKLMEYEENLREIQEEQRKQSARGFTPNQIKFMKEVQYT